MYTRLLAVMLVGKHFPSTVRLFTWQFSFSSSLAFILLFASVNIQQSFGFDFSSFSSPVRCTGFEHLVNVCTIETGEEKEDKAQQWNWSSRLQADLFSRKTKANVDLILHLVRRRCRNKIFLLVRSGFNARRGCIGILVDQPIDLEEKKYAERCWWTPRIWPYWRFGTNRESA